MEWHDQLISWLGTFILITGFLTVIFRRFDNILTCYKFQSFALAFMTLIIAHQYGEAHLYGISLATFIVKFLLIPIWVMRVIVKIPGKLEDHASVGAAFSLFSAVALLLLSYIISRDILGINSEKVDDLAISLTLLLLGLYQMMTRRKAIIQMMGILFMENAITLAGITLAKGLPTVIEMGIIFDVLIGILVMITLVFRIQEAFDSIDTQNLKSLKG